MIKKLAIIGLLATGTLFSCSQSSETTTTSGNQDLAVADSTILNEHSEMTASGNDAETDDLNAQWNQIDRNSPSVKLPEVTVIGLETRGNKDYTVYSMGETVLFDEGKAELKANAKQTLDQIVLSIAQRAKGEIRIYGHADASEGTTRENTALSSKRAMAVRNWLVENGNVEESRISVQPMGESQPKATGDSASAKKQNRRVDIVAMTDARKAK
jgi:outer membrane protein OmpA-like peptidoglycan-associated protein